MKLKLLLSGLLLCVFSMSAQDVITMTDGSTIKAKVEEITDSAVKYRKHTNLTGPVYTLKLDAVSKIVYQNGTTDLFNAPAVEPAETPAESVENGQPTPTQPQTQLNEAELLKMAKMADFDVYSEKDYAAKLKKKAKTYKLVGWIGGGVIVTAGIVLPFVLTDLDAGYGDNFLVIVGPVVGGAAWCVAWNVAANKQMKKARMAEAYSVPVIEGEMLRIGNNPLMGSINVMGDNFTRSRSLGLGLTYKF